MKIKELIEVLEKYKGKEIETLCLGLVVETDNDQEENAIFAVIGRKMHVLSVLDEIVEKIDKTLEGEDDNGNDSAN